MKTLLIVILVLIVVAIAYYYFIYQNQPISLGAANMGSANQDLSPATSATLPLPPQFLPPPVYKSGDNVYLKLDAPSPGSTYAPDETVVYSAPLADANGTYVIGKITRKWYGNQPVGTFVANSSNGWVKVRVGMVSDFTFAPYDILGHVYGAPITQILKGMGSKDVFFRDGYVTNKQY